MTRCHICERPCTRELEPPFGKRPAVTAPDVWTVAMGNGLYVSACHPCWMKWPWEHRLYPSTGLGRSDDEPKRSRIALEEFVELVGTA